MAEAVGPGQPIVMSWFGLADLTETYRKTDARLAVSHAVLLIHQNKGKTG